MEKVCNEMHAVLIFQLEIVKKYNQWCSIFIIISTPIVLAQGSTVSLQLMQNDRWLDCAGDRCNGAGCPGLFFEGNDLKNCQGEIFKMYRASGSGSILSGDFVGLYYPHGKQWFSMFNGRGHKQGCPGKPSTTLGFERIRNWLHCSAEVFQVYAKGKPEGAEITDQDTISLYYPNSRNNVVFKTDEIVLDTCMMKKSGDSRPPSNHAFDVCTNMAVEITIS